VGNGRGGASLVIFALLDGGSLPSESRTPAATPPVVADFLWEAGVVDGLSEAADFAEVADFFAVLDLELCEAGDETALPLSVLWTVFTVDSNFLFPGIESQVRVKPTVQSSHKWWNKSEACRVV
jgi:hypothetical protein